MFHVVCKLPNASALISGVKFRQHDNGSMITHEPVGDIDAAKFRDVPGYTVVEIVPVTKVTSGRPSKAEAEAKKAAEAAEVEAKRVADVAIAAADAAEADRLAEADKDAGKGEADKTDTADEPQGDKDPDKPETF